MNKPLIRKHPLLVKAGQQRVNNVLTTCSPVNSPHPLGRHSLPSYYLVVWTAPIAAVGAGHVGHRAPRVHDQVKAASGRAQVQCCVKVPAGWGWVWEDLREAYQGTVQMGSAHFRQEYIRARLY